MAGLTINGRFLTAQPTGVHRVAHELTRQLGRHSAELAALFGAEPRIIAPRGADPSRLEAGIALDTRSRLCGHAWEQLELPIRARGTLLLSLCNMAPVLAPRAVTMIHDAQTFASPQSYSRGFRGYYRVMQPLIGARACRVLTVSEHSRGELIRYGIARAGKIEVIPNGADHARRIAADGAVLRRLGLTPGRYVLALGSAQAHKNIAILLGAFAHGGLSDLSLVLFGAGGAARLTQAGLTLPPETLCPGRVTDEELAALMASALCLAMPSRTEGFGLPPLEAMALGCPAVVAPCGALPEVCGDGALYAGPDDAGAWRDAFRLLADWPDARARLAERGAARAAQLSWEAAGHRLMATLRPLAARRTRTATA